MSRFSNVKQICMKSIQAAILHLIRSMFEGGMKFYSTVLRCLYTRYSIQISNQSRRPYLCRIQMFFIYALQSYHNQRQSTQQKCSQGLWIFLLILFLKLNKTDCLYRNWSCRQYSFCLYINGYKNRDRDIELHSYLTPKYGRHFIVWHINISVMQNQNNIYYIYLRI